MKLVFPGQTINPVVENSDEQLPSLSDLHDYEPKLEFDDTEINEPYKPSPIQGALPLSITIIILPSFHPPTHTGCAIFNVYLPWQVLRWKTM